MKKTFLSFLFILTVNTITIAQTVNSYSIVAFHKLMPGQTIEDAIAVEKQWLPIHQARKSAGIISEWLMFVPYNNFKSNLVDFDYITVNGGPDLDKLSLYPMELFSDLQKKDPGFKNLSALTSKTQRIIRQMITKKINGTSKGTNKSQFLQLDLLQVSNGSAFEEHAKKIVNVQEERVATGSISGWSLYETLYPSSVDMDVDYTSIQSFDKLSKIDEAWQSYQVAIPKVLNISAEELVKNLRAVRVVSKSLLTTVELSTK